jgi:hypothetical protein
MGIYEIPVIPCIIKGKPVKYMQNNKMDIKNGSESPSPGRFFIFPYHLNREVIGSGPHPRHYSESGVSRREKGWLRPLHGLSTLCAAAVRSLLGTPGSRCDTAVKTG